MGIKYVQNMLKLKPNPGQNHVISELLRHRTTPIITKTTITNIQVKRRLH